jgi:GNAT superfamily N-acetyltransferase
MIDSSRTTTELLPPQPPADQGGGVTDNRLSTHPETGHYDSAGDPVSPDIGVAEAEPDTNSGPHDAASMPADQIGDSGDSGFVVGVEATDALTPDKQAPIEVHTQQQITVGERAGGLAVNVDDSSEGIVSDEDATDTEAGEGSGHDRPGDPPRPPEGPGDKWDNDPEPDPDDNPERQARISAAEARATQSAAAAENARDAYNAAFTTLEANPDRFGELLEASVAAENEATVATQLLDVARVEPEPHIPGIADESETGQEYYKVRESERVDTLTLPHGCWVDYCEKDDEDGEPTMMIGYIQVAPLLQGNGIGTRLIGAVRDQAADQNLSTVTANAIDPGVIHGMARVFGPDNVNFYVVPSRSPISIEEATAYLMASTDEDERDIWARGYL